MTVATQTFSAMLAQDRRPPRMWDDSAEEKLICRGIVPVTEEISTSSSRRRNHDSSATCPASTSP